MVRFGIRDWGSGGCGVGWRGLSECIGWCRLMMLCYVVLL